MEENLDSRLIYDGHVVKLRLDKFRLSNGKIVEREIIERINSVFILPIINNEAILLEQYSPAHKKNILKIPGGGIDNLDNNAEEAAQRELFEETSYKARSLELLFESGGSNTIRQTTFYYLATQLYYPNEPRKKDENEFFKLIKKPFMEVLKMAKNAEFPNPAISLMILMAEEKLKMK